jgi:hypothetical protein
MMKQAIYRRLLEILAAEEAPAGFAYLEQEEKRRILQILGETKDDLPEGWPVEG